MARVPAVCMERNETVRPWDLPLPSRSSAGAPWRDQAPAWSRPMLVGTGMVRTPARHVFHSGTSWGWREVPEHLIQSKTSPQGNVFLAAMPQHRQRSLPLVCWRPDTHNTEDAQVPPSHGLHRSPAMLPGNGTHTVLAARARLLHKERMLQPPASGGKTHLCMRQKSNWFRSLNVNASSGRGRDLPPDWQKATPGEGSDTSRAVTSHPQHAHIAQARRGTYIACFLWMLTHPVRH